MLLLNLKNIRYKTIVFFFVMILIFCTLINVENLGALQAFRSVMGGNELFRPMVIISFMIYVALIQYMHIDSIMVILRNDTYLRIRYKTKSLLFKRIVLDLFIINIICMFLTFISWSVSMFLCVQRIELMEWKQVLEICIRGYLTNNIFIIIQSILLIKRNESYAFLNMIILSVVLVVISHSDLKVISICPFYLDFVGLVLNIGVCNIYILTCLFIYRKMYMEREHEQYGN